MPGTCFGNAFVAELNPEGSALAYSTYLGGSVSDVAEAIAVDSFGNAYVTGQTLSSDFPITPGAFQTACKDCSGGGSSFVTKLNASGSALVYSTFLGGSSGEVGSGIAVDFSGDAYVAGGTSSRDFPITPGAFQTTCGGGSNNCGYGDAFVTQLNSTGSALVYSTYLGGSLIDDANSITTDASGNAYVTGETDSADFPITAGVFQPSLAGNYDSFVTELNSAGSALIYSTYLGGSGTDLAYGIALDTSGDAYVTGETNSVNFPTTAGAFQTNCGGGCTTSDAFVSKLSTTGSTLLYSTYVGGSGYDEAHSVALDVSGNAYVSGWTFSSDFPTTPGAFDPICKACANLTNDGFFSELRSDGSTLLYSTYLGGSGYNNSFTVGDWAYGIAVDPAGGAYVAGRTSSTDFPVTPGAFQGTCGGGCAQGAPDAFITKFVPGDQAWPLSLTFGNQAVGTTSAAQTTTLTNSGSTQLNITSINITGANAADFAETNTCGTSLSAGATCMINVTFTPMAPGARTAAVAISDNAANSPQTVALSGEGIGALVALSATSLTFPTQVIFTTSQAQRVTLTNTGTGSLTISSIAATGPFSQTNTCGTSVAPGASCAISVTFKPKSKGTLTGAVTVTDNAPGSPQKVTLSGCGTYIQFSTPTLNFGNQPVGTKSPAKKVTVTNKGSAAVSITSISIGGSNAGDFAETNTCRSSLASGANCSISVTFTPAKQGKRSGEISINDNGGCSPQMVAVTGTGTP
jgi:hypothetical protein